MNATPVDVSVAMATGGDQWKHLPIMQRVGRLGVADPLFVPLTTRGAGARSEPDRYGWSFGTPQDGAGAPSAGIQTQRLAADHSLGEEELL